MIKIDFLHSEYTESDKLNIIEKLLSLGWVKDIAYKLSDSPNSLLADPMSVYWFKWDKKSEPLYPDFVPYIIN